MSKHAMEAFEEVCCLPNLVVPAIPVTVQRFSLRNRALLRPVRRRRRAIVSLLQRLEMRLIAPISVLFRMGGTLMAERTAQLPITGRISREKVR